MTGILDINIEGMHRYYLDELAKEQGKELSEEEKEVVLEAINKVINSITIEIVQD